ncbi:hypothetical protein SE18_01050 [Herpetosiphon geysericola]|uniref:Uncharacterized protein n=1 Tax=Herpetosiphon geysericola TaxID=70996 RepID=A0A0P6YHC0_9CHLR|nr:hypothetical protein SE18_01050 [Herpetosiphon geysericola]
MRFPPAEGRKGGEKFYEGRNHEAREEREGEKHGAIEATVIIPNPNIRGCRGMKTPSVSLQRRDGREAKNSTKDETTKHAKNAKARRMGQ